MEQPYSDIENQEIEFERKYRKVLSEVGQKRIGADQAHVMLMKDYAALRNNPDSSSDCVYAGREYEILEALTLAEQRAKLGMDDSATKSLAQLAEEKAREKRSRVSWLVPVGAFALAFGLSSMGGDRVNVRQQHEYRAPQEIRHRPNYHPQLIREIRDDAPKKDPDKGVKDDSVPRWE